MKRAVFGKDPSISKAALLAVRRSNPPALETLRVECAAGVESFFVVHGCADNTPPVAS